MWICFEEILKILSLFWENCEVILSSLSGYRSEELQLYTDVISSE